MSPSSRRSGRHAARNCDFPSGAPGLVPPCVRHRRFPDTVGDWHCNSAARTDRTHGRTNQHCETLERTRQRRAVHTGVDAVEKVALATVMHL
jgi:hypothetical protein